MKLILLRHGESEWNLKNRFTGWKDVDLTSNGIKEATAAANKILEENINISSIHTSILERAQHTTKIISKILKFDANKVVYDWRLNERHYGSLEGLNKSETAKKYGEKQVHIWRRSYDVAPPMLEFDDIRHPRFNKKFAIVPIKKLPIGESLEMVIERMKPFWENYVKDIKKQFDNHMIIAHSNSLRAIVKMLDNKTNEEITTLNIPTGVPLVYKFNKNFNIKSKKFLIDEEKLKLKQKEIASQGKVK